MEKSPYTDKASAASEHNRLIEKGRKIAASIKGEPWDDPQQAPFYGSGINIDMAIPFLQGLIEDIKAEESK